MDKIKLAVLGLNQGSKIARDAKANPEIELVAVAGFGDHDVKVAEELGVPLYNDYTLLLKQEDLDAVAIALPNTLHVQSTELALAAGIKNILLEKPIANTVEEAEHIIKTLVQRSWSAIIAALPIATSCFVRLSTPASWARSSAFSRTTLSQSLTSTLMLNGTQRRARVLF